MHSMYDTAVRGYWSSYVENPSSFLEANIPSLLYLLVPKLHAVVHDHSKSHILDSIMVVQVHVLCCIICFILLIVLGIYHVTPHTDTTNSTHPGTLGSYRAPLRTAPAALPSPSCLSRSGPCLSSLRTSLTPSTMRPRPPLPPLSWHSMAAASAPAGCEKRRFLAMMMIARLLESRCCRRSAMAAPR